MKDWINRVLALVVRVNFYVYLLVGISIGLCLHFFGWQKTTSDHLELLNYIGMPMIIYSMLQRLFCMIFYQGKYNEFPFRKITHRRHIGIPKTDDIFYIVINEKNLNRGRKISGYIYAVSKPLIFINFGLVVTSLFFLMISRA